MPNKGKPGALIPYSNTVNPFAYETSEPAPMGIADYGVDSAGAYSYATNSSLGIVNIGSLSTSASANYSMTFQQNVNLLFHDNGFLYVYWIQNVAFVNTTNANIQFINNIWNFSSSSASMSATGVSGSGQVAFSGSTGYYYDLPNSSSLLGNNVTLGYPSTIMFRVNSSVSSLGKPMVSFEYNDSYGWQTYDNVTFLTSHPVSSLAGFVVDGMQYNPFGTFYDSELILGGPGGGANSTDVSSDVRLELKYWNGHNYQEVKTAYNFGSDTAEGIGNVSDAAYYYEDNGTLFSLVQAGSGNLTKLYDGTQMAILDISTPLSSGTIYVRNASNPSAIVSKIPFVSSQAEITLFPGKYLLELYQGNLSYGSGAINATAGNNSLFLGYIPLEFSYSIQGGGSGYSAPTFTYYYNGIKENVTLISSPVTYYADNGSTWTVLSQLTGSTGTERWVLNQENSGTATTVLETKFEYYNQYNLTIGYTIMDGGSGYSTPMLSYSSLGSTRSATLSSNATSYWVDGGSSWSVTNPLADSTTTERWETVVDSGTMTVAGTITLDYYHQYSEDFDFSVTGSGSGYTAPNLNFTDLGAEQTVYLAATQSVCWLDSGSIWNVTNPLGGSNSTIRWETTTPSGAVLSSGTISPVYDSQYFVSWSISPETTGTISPFTSDWYSSGTVVQIIANPGGNNVFSNWSTNNSLISFTNANSNSTTAIIDGPGMIQANFSPLQVTSSTTSSTSSASNTTITSSTAPTSSSSNQSKNSGNSDLPIEVGIPAVVVILAIASLLVIRSRRGWTRVD
jgi:hypothetical protein